MAHGCWLNIGVDPNVSASSHSAISHSFDSPERPFAVNATFRILTATRNAASDLSVFRSF